MNNPYKQKKTYALSYDILKTECLSYGLEERLSWVMKT